MRNQSLTDDQITEAEQLYKAGQSLARIGERFGVTKEPTPNFRLDNEQQHSCYQLAELLAADRASHLADTILPALKAHDVGVTDRYIAS
ncbi:hypothetical protein [Nocardia farcinica]|uniref:hypothetical protein n=1 Tax=Nocardia farcinica TaxID=37329 RepID=UPI0024583D58|nr:hypothetical protein [Nocardia farcinica]